MCHGKDLCGQVPAFFLSGDPLVNGPHSSDARLAQRWHCGKRGLHSKRSLLWKKCGVWGRKCTLHSSSCVLNVYFQSTMTKIDINAGSAGAKCKCVWFMSIFLFLFSSKTCVWVNVIIVCSPWRILDFKKNSCICCESSWVKTLRFLKVINHKWCLHGPPPGCVSRRTGTSRIVLQPHTRLSIKHPWTQHKGGGLKVILLGCLEQCFQIQAPIHAPPLLAAWPRTALVAMCYLNGPLAADGTARAHLYFGMFFIWLLLLRSHVSFPHAEFILTCPVARRDWVSSF